MGYYIYEDDPTKQMTLHDGGCRYCNNGAGVRPTRRSNNRWYPPFADLPSARAAADASGKNLRLCKVCLGDR
jgi:hypothetical protein